MKKLTALLLAVVMVMTLAACGTDTPDPTTVPTIPPTTQPTEAPTTEPPTEPATEPPTEPATEPPTEPTTEPTVVLTEEEKFQELLTHDNGYWYWRILGCVFKDPKDISMEHMFYIGLELEERENTSDFTDDEIAYLSDSLRDTMWGEEGWVEAIKLPATRLDEVLQQYLGVALADVTIPEDWIYYEGTDAYYAVHTDSYSAAGSQVTLVEYAEDGTIQVHWTIGFMLNTATGEFMQNPELILTLQPKEDGSYLVLSNTVVKPEPGPLSEDELVEFITLLTWQNGSDSMWYNYALKSQYATAADVNLFELFYSAPMEELTQEDKDFLNSIGENPAGDPMVHKYSISTMDAVLQNIFGITFDECSGVGLEKMIYNPDGECYYHRHGDFLSAYASVSGGERLEDGTILIYYTDPLSNPEEPTPMTLTLVPAGFGYHIVSNVISAE